MAGAMPSPSHNGYDRRFIGAFLAELQLRNHPHFPERRWFTALRRASEQLRHPRRGGRWPQNPSRARAGPHARSGSQTGSGANFKKGRRADPCALGERESLACQIGPKFKLCTRSVCIRSRQFVPPGIRAWKMFSGEGGILHTTNTFVVSMKSSIECMNENGWLRASFLKLRTRTGIASGSTLALPRLWPGPSPWVLLA